MTAVSVRLPARQLTLDDVAELAQQDPDHRYELQEGNLIVMPPADAEHNRIIFRIALWLAANGFDEDQVNITPGVRIGDSGRSPDLVVTTSVVPGRTVWFEPAVLLLAVEVVSPGSKQVDRLIKPREYAAVGIPNFWRVERDGAPTVHMFGLGVDAEGSPAYVPRGSALLDDLRKGPVPDLIPAG